ncbi:MAG TPA: efflux RND transporter periplasmic adaptor subunit [Gemmatimonadaceae bacterium]|nr:efflux RND transporter periplasmic adaptor subunit [Gemmatimonadaceae bacterium]
MQKNKITAIVVVLLLAVTGVLLYQRADAKQRPTYRFATIARGNLQSTVSATGTLSAVTTVQVGTQVSGQVSAIYADFNQKVKKGQLLARIDPTLAQQAVQDAQTGVERAQAQLTQAEGDYERNKQLIEQKVITASEFGTSQSAYDVAKANLTSARIALQRAQKNLSYTNIYAPIDGVIVERNVDVGQTVAASLSAPQLFLIANDLSQMQILASVDESDIGVITNGMPVNFTVQAYPDQSFTGTVKQVRLQSTTQDNVVNYTVVVQVQNPNGKLLPGMTATVQFLMGSASGALLVPNAALRFRATPEMLAEAGIASRANGTAGDSSRARAGAGTGASTGASGAAASVAGSAGGSSGSARARFGGAGGSARPSGGQRPSVAMLWYLNKAGKLAVARVRTGLTDGQSTQITTRDSSITPGMQVIVGVTDGKTAAASNTSASPFQPQGGRGPRGGF